MNDKTIAEINRELDKIITFSLTGLLITVFALGVKIASIFA